MESNIQIVRSQDEIQKRINSITEEIRALASQDELTVVGILDDAFVLTGWSNDNADNFFSSLVDISLLTADA